MLLAAPGLAAAQTGPAPEMSPGAKPVPDDQGVYKPDPSYDTNPYDPKAQINIYGGKHAIDDPRPIEALRLQYEGGPFDQGLTFLGERNLVFPAFQASGDWRTAIANNHQNNKQNIGQVATTVDLDVDLGITSTERLHGFFRPLERHNEFTRCEFFSANADGHCSLKANAIPQDLFFEGDMGSIYTGLTGQYTTLDLPFAVGLIPMIFQNGIWVNNAFTGFAFSLPAKNSPMLDISNMDITYFAGFDKVVTPALLNNDGSRADHNANIWGVAAFVEANHGYWEGGYGYVQGKDRFQDLSYSSATIAYTGRIRDISSNSIRLFWNFGQNPPNGQQKTGDGFAILLENSAITSAPYTLLPYFNLWAGFSKPVPLTSTNGNLLTNTGINFQTDALTNFPKLDDSANNTYGGALGIEYLFNLDQQIVLEAATVQVMGNDTGRNAKGNEYALGVRYQLPLTLDWILRADAMQGWQINNKNVSGARVELRRKF